MRTANIGPTLIKGPSLSAVLFFSIFILSTFLVTSNASAWWSTGTLGESVHEQISNKAFDIVLGRLVNKPFLRVYRDSIVSYTTSAENDTSAHGGNSERNGGNIALWFYAFSTYYNAKEWDKAAEYLGYCLHLIEDMNVPAHAFNIPHVDYPDFDNFEFMADEGLNKSGIISLPNIVIAETDPPDDPTSYYTLARDATQASVFSNGFSEYWHLGNGPDWNGDGPQGYYHDQITNEDIFPKLYSNMSQQETNFLVGQLSEAVRYVGMFLLAVDRWTGFFLTVKKKRINKGDGLVESDDGTISCESGTTVSRGLYSPNALVTLGVTPSPGSLFEGWTPTSLNCGASPTCSFTISANTKVTAVFRGPYGLLTKIKSKNEGSGTVTADVSGIGTGIDCPASCADSYPYGTNVVLTAQPIGNSQFMGWKPASLECGTNLTCTVPMTKKWSVTATFGIVSPP
jgi:Divergent InlB B-repeat domain